MSKELRADEHTGGFYFKRAFVTAFAILTAVSAFLAAWALFWAITIGGLWSLGRQDGEPNMQDPETSQTCTPEPGAYDC